MSICKKYMVIIRKIKNEIEIAMRDIDEEVRIMAQTCIKILSLK